MDKWAIIRAAIIAPFVCYILWMIYKIIIIEYENTKEQIEKLKDKGV